MGKVTSHNFYGRFHPLTQWGKFSPASSPQNNPLAKAHRPFSPRLFFEAENAPKKAKK